MRIIDLFSGEGGKIRRSDIESMGHEYITVDINKRFNPDITADILTLDYKSLGPADLIWASPPCNAYSVASFRYHWKIENNTRIPISELTVISEKLVLHTLEIINLINPKGWLMENPRGMLRKMPYMRGIHRTTVTYCQYGEKYRKPTDLWGFIPGWYPPAMCHNGDKCHESSPRGNKMGGLQGINNRGLRAVVPLELWIEIINAMENNYLPPNYIRQPELMIV